jgi:putative flippase GtrA
MSLEGITNKSTERMDFLTKLLTKLRARPGVRQLLKFCIVGASSAVIDFGLSNWLYYKVGWGIFPSLSIPFFLAVCNGFYWNRRWTFQKTEEDAKKQYPKFILTNSIGWGLNLTIMTSVLILAERMGFLRTQRSLEEIIRAIIYREGHTFAPLALNAAKVVATLCVTAWNFTAARLWTFKK